jgi:MSHA biogenesis protein MshN
MDHRADRYGGDLVLVDCLADATMSSVINRMLNQLEQRGAHNAMDQTMVRAVPRRKRSFKFPLLATGLALVAGIAVWQWIQIRKPEHAVTLIVPNIGNMPIARKVDQLAQQQPVAEAAAVAEVPAAALPASRLTFELSSVPLPSMIRQDSEHTSTNEKVASNSRNESVKPAKQSAKKSATQAAKTLLAADSIAVDQAPDSVIPMKKISPEQKADAEFRNAVALMQQGHTPEAISGYEAALRLDPNHDRARQALVALLLESKRSLDAEQVVQERLKSKPDHTAFTMLLARLQVERGAVEEATATLGKGLPYARSNADYQAFLAALLQRLNRNDEAISHYQVALQLAPNNGIWQMGYGISLQAMQRKADAKVAFQHALDTQTLSPDLQSFVRQKLKEL